MRFIMRCRGSNGINYYSKKMRLLVLSDIHVEIWGETLPLFDIPVSTVDLVILAGDIHTKSRAPAWAAKVFKDLPVLYVAGNHEFYGQTIEKTGDAIRRECQKYNTITYLDCSEYLSNGVRFLGTTLWTDFLLFGVEQRYASMLEAQSLMNDYRRIRIAEHGYKRLSPQDTQILNSRHRAWLEKKLSEQFDGPTVVITHMAPSMHSIPAEYIKDRLSAAYASSLDNIVAKADIWIHGHTHTSVDYELNGCRIIANPLGYPNRGVPENKNFDPCFIVQVGSVGNK